LHRRPGLVPPPALGAPAATGAPRDRGGQCPTRCDQCAESPLARHVFPPIGSLRFFTPSPSTPTVVPPFVEDSLTTCMWVGAQESCTLAPPPGSCCRWASSMFGTRTVIRTSP